MRIAAILVVLTTSAVAFADSPAYSNPPLKPFTSVQDVCRTCSNGPHFDTIKLRSGKTVHAYVAAQNPDFYFLMRFGEFRAVGRPRVASISRNPTRDKVPSYPDQILFKDGTVLGGKLKPPTTNKNEFQIVVPPQNKLQSGTYVAIAEVFQGGKLTYSARAQKKK